MIDEAIPVHVSELPAGAQLRVSMKAGYHLDRDFTGAGASPKRGRRAFGYSRTTFFAFLIANDPINGRMTVSASDLNPSAPTFSAVIEYKNVLFMQRIVSRGRPVVETAPVTHPGAAALGTKMAQFFQQPFLVPVLFVGK